eukprot:305158-Amphidinium_carterae.1
MNLQESISIEHYMWCLGGLSWATSLASHGLHVRACPNSQPCWTLLWLPSSPKETAQGPRNAHAWAMKMEMTPFCRRFASELAQPRPMKKTKPRARNI